MESEFSRPDPIVKTLLQDKWGSVHCVVRGPIEGFLWRRVELFRWVPSTKEPGQFDKVNFFRHSDLRNLEAAVKAARKVCET